MAAVLLPDALWNLIEPASAAFTGAAERWTGRASFIAHAHRNDSQEALALVDPIPPLQGGRGRPRCRRACLLGDRGYDAAFIRSGLRTRHILPLLAMRRTKRQRLGAMALGCRADVRIAESIPPSTRPLRQTARHPRGVPLAWLCMDLLAVAAEGWILA